MVCKKIVFYILTCVVCFAFISGNIRAQENLDFSGKASARTIIHNGSLPPLWQTSLYQGRWDNLGGSQLLSLASAKSNWKVSDLFSVYGNVEIDHNTSLDETYLHTGWLGVNFGRFSVKGGKHLFDPVFTESNSGSGSYIFGSNYRPAPRVTLELSDYTVVPFTKRRIEVRGGISQGWLSDQPANGDVLLHEKYGYIRWNGGKWKPYAGLNHSSLFGGEDIAIDFWATFMAKGSEKVGGGEATNAAGAHMGLYDIGTYVNTSIGSFQFYYQIPFSDGSGMVFWQRNRDHILGINWSSDIIPWLSNLTFEWIQTKYQSGNGMPDPILNGRIIFASDVDDKNAFVLEHFGIDKSAPLSSDEFIAILEDELNHGNKFGGRDGYMNNGVYPDGWSHRNYIMGNPFHLTQKQLLSVNPDMDFEHRVKIKNDRLSGVHLGAKGEVFKGLKWATKISYTRNFGTYYEQYPGRYTWDETDDYWFSGGRNQWYTLLNFSWEALNVKGLNIQAGIAFDTGEIYTNTGINFGITYNLPASVKKQ